MCAKSIYYTLLPQFIFSYHLLEPLLKPSETFSNFVSLKDCGRFLMPWFCTPTLKMSTLKLVNHNLHLLHLSQNYMLISLINHYHFLSKYVWQTYDSFICHCKCSRGNCFWKLGWLRHWKVRQKHVFLTQNDCIIK